MSTAWIDYKKARQENQKVLNCYPLLVFLVGYSISSHYIWKILKNLIILGLLIWGICKPTKLVKLFIYYLVNLSVRDLRKVYN